MQALVAAAKVVCAATYKIGARGLLSGRPGVCYERLFCSGRRAVAMTVWVVEWGGGEDGPGICGEYKYVNECKTCAGR